MDSINIDDLSDKELLHLLLQYDPHTGPVTDATRSVYKRKLIRMKSESNNSTAGISKDIDSLKQEAYLTNNDNLRSHDGEDDSFYNSRSFRYESSIDNPSESSYTSDHLSKNEYEPVVTKKFTAQSNLNSFQFKRQEEPEIRKRETIYLASSHEKSDEPEERNRQSIYMTSSYEKSTRSNEPEKLNRESNYITSSYDRYAKANNMDRYSSPGIYEDVLKSPYSRPAINSINHSYGSSSFNSATSSSSAIVANNSQWGKILIISILALILFGYLVYNNMEGATTEIVDI